MAGRESKALWVNIKEKLTEEGRQRDELFRPQRRIPPTSAGGWREESSSERQQGFRKVGLN